MIMGKGEDMMRGPKISSELQRRWLADVEDGHVNMGGGGCRAQDKLGD